MPLLYRVFATLALLEFLGLGTLHFAAVLGVSRPSFVYAFATLPLIFLGQLVTIFGLQGGSLARVGKAPGLARPFRLGVVALRYVPALWKIVGIPFWYLYIPITFFSRLIRSGGTVEETGGRFLLKEHGHVIRELTAEQATSSRTDQFVAMTVIFMGFALAHFIMLRFIVPNRGRILEDA